MFYCLFRHIFFEVFFSLFFIRVVFDAFFFFFVIFCAIHSRMKQTYSANKTNKRFFHFLSFNMKKSLKKKMPRTKKKPI